MRNGFLCAVAIFALAPFAVAGDKDVAQQINRLQNDLLPPVLIKGESSSSTLAKRMAELHVPAVSIAVIHDRHLEWARGFGVSRADGAPATEYTLFQAASLSKPVTALAVLRLVQAGKLDLDADVNQYLKGWKVPNNDFTQQSKVTVRGLLSHSAGVTVESFEGYPAGNPLPTPLQILNGELPANNPAVLVDMAPGKTWRYSGGGFVIVQQILSDQTAKTFPKLMRELVLGPLAMDHSYYYQPLPADLMSHAAMPFRGDGTEMKGGPYVYPELAAAGLWATPSDLARYALALQEATSGRSKRVLSAAMAEEMTRPQIDQQALGLKVGGSTARKYFIHNGANVGYQCLLIAYDDGDGAVIMTNSENGLALAREIVRTIAHEYGWPDYAPPIRTIVAIESRWFDAHVGAYQLPSGDIATFWRDARHLRSRVWGEPVHDMFPASRREYFLKEEDVRWVFSASDDGSNTAGAVEYKNGIAQTAKLLDEAKGKSLLDFSIATEKRYQAQTAAPGSEMALRSLISGVASGHPLYDQMTPEFAELNRAQLAFLQPVFARPGPVQALAFKGVGPAGEDIYDVKFQNESLTFSILLNIDGRVYSAIFSP